MIELPEQLKNTAYEISILSTDGKIVRELLSTTQKIDIGQLDSGQYIVRIACEKGFWNKLLLKL